MLKECQGIIDSQLKAGIIEKVVDLEVSDRCHYLPHRPVVRHEAETTKVRMVFDASAKSGKHGVSLNDCLHVGPSLNPLMYDILLRFRMGRTALTADIEQAFLNIEVDSVDRDSLRFLWSTNPFDENAEVQIYRLCRVPFGVRSSPFLLNGTLRYHLQQYRAAEPEFVRNMYDSLYVDDMVFSAGDVESVYGMYERSRSALSSGGFRLRKWVSNNSELTARIRCKEMDFDKNDESLDKAVKNEDDTMHKVLGLCWNFKTDTVLFDFQPIIQRAENMKPTKREILSLLTGVFDPLGVISPIQVSMKILFQQLCKEKLEWDDEISEDLRRKWMEWVNSLKKAEFISMNRCVLQNMCVTNANKVVLHGFCDASQDAYCANIYVVYEGENGKEASLLTSKTRVSPLKSLSIPRLELMGARILTTLKETVKNAIKCYVEVVDVCYWSDSMTALHWIQNKHEWKQFVQSRVNEILKVTNKQQWRHCPGEMNPADLGSRGVQALSLKESQLWWQGPSFLTEESKNLDRIPENDGWREYAEEEKKVTSLSVQGCETKKLTM